MFTALLNALGMEFAMGCKMRGPCVRITVAKHKPNNSEKITPGNSWGNNNQQN